MTYRLISTLSLIALASVPAPALAKRLQTQFKKLAAKG